MKDMMRAVGLYEYLPIDDENSFIDVLIDKPSPKGKDILVQVQALSVNPIDTKIRVSKDIKEESPRILGWDVSGIVVAVGEGCEHYKIGDEVFYAGDIKRAGAYSEYHLVHEDLVGHKPKTLSHQEAAALPLTSLAAYEALFERLGIKEDNEANKEKTLLIINASGGVGTMALQFAKHVGLKVIGTASRKETRAWALDYGADEIVNHKKDLIKAVRDLGYEYVDYILCLHNTELHWDAMAELVAPLGSICSLVTANKDLDMLLLKDKSASFSYEFMFTKAMFKTQMITQQHILNKVSDLIDQQALKTSMNKHMSPINAETMKEAHKLLESQRSIGKIVMSDFK